MRGFKISYSGTKPKDPFARMAAAVPHQPKTSKMEAERINYVNNLCEDLAHRLVELRGYL